MRWRRALRRSSERGDGAVDDGGIVALRANAIVVRLLLICEFSYVFVRFRVLTCSN
jgi:hypothetical protein